MALRIFFDARYIRTDYHDGISRYSAELGAALYGLTPVTFLICNEGQRALLPNGADCITIHEPTSSKEPFTSLILNQYQPDVVYSPMQTMGSYGRKFKLILTLHDLIYYRHRTPPHHLSPILRLGWWLYHATYIPQRKVLNSADLVVTVSETSKREIQKAHLTKRPIVVATNAPQALEQYLDGPVDTSRAPKNLIYMGSFMEYKNVETLIRGMAQLEGFTLHLLSRVAPARKAQLKSLIPKGAKVVFHNGVSDEQYAKLLANRALLVSASLDEGFGIPVTEAMTLGVPAVITDMPIFKEVAGKAGVFFNATQPEDFARAVHEASQPEPYKKLSKLSVEQSRQFTWSRSAKALYDSMKNL